MHSCARIMPPIKHGETSRSKRISLTSMQRHCLTQYTQTAVAGYLVKFRSNPYFITMEATLACFCKKTFQRKQEYINHARICFRGLSENNRNIICAICKKSISSASYFVNTHLNFHEGRSKRFSFSFNT